MIPESSEQKFKALLAENKKMREALEGLICWIGKSPDGPPWATPDAKRRSRQMFEEAMSRAVDCFPKDYNGTAGGQDKSTAPATQLN